MKMTKKLFVVLLMAAVLVSSFTFFASAETVTEDNYKNLLDFYEQPAVFGFDFSKADVDYSDALLASNPNKATDSIVEDAAAPGGKYLDVKIASTRPYGQENVYLSWNDNIGITEFYFDAVVSAGNLLGNATANPRYRLVIDDEMLLDVRDGSAADISLFSLDFRSLSEVNLENGVFSYLKLDETGAPVNTPTDYKLSADSWYKVEVTYSATANSVVISVTNIADETDTITVDDAYAPLSVIRNIRFGVHKNDGGNSNCAVLKIANVVAAGGTNRRDLPNQQSVIEEGILSVKGLFDASTDDAAKFDMATTVGKLQAYGFTTDKEEVNTAISTMLTAMKDKYVEELTRLADEEELLVNYAERRPILDVSYFYAKILESLGASDSEELTKDITATIAKYNDIVRAESDSLAIIAALKDVPDSIIMSDDFTVYSPYYLSVMDYVADSTYPGVEESLAKFIILETKYLDVETKGSAFVTNANKAANEELTLAERCESFLLVKDSNFDDATYPGFTEAKAALESVRAYLAAEIEAGTSFLNLVNSADYADYISAKEGYLAIAGELKDTVNLDYPGIPEALELYAEIEAFIKTQKENAKAYIDAVAALETLSGTALQNAVNKALELKEKGNVLGVEGVAEANIKLDAISSKLDIRDEYIEYFIYAVGSIDKAATGAEKFAAITEALAAEKNVAADGEGVSAASAKLASAVADYNAQAEKANASFKSATELAVNAIGVCTSASPTAALVVKKFEL